MDVGELTEAEQRIVDAVGSGRLIDLREPGDSTDPTESATWRRSRAVRARVLAELLTSLADGAPAVRIRGARITGHLNLGGRRLNVPIELRDCAFVGKVYLAKAAMPEMSMRGSYFRFGISGRSLSVDGVLNLTGCWFDHRLYLKRVRARVIFLDEAVVSHPSGLAVQMRGAEIEQELYARDGFAAHGYVLLYGAKIGGQASFEGARLLHSDRSAMNLRNMIVGQDLRMRGINTVGGINLGYAKIGGNLELGGANLRATDPTDSDDEPPHALRATACQVDGDVELDNGFTAEGEVSLYDARIGGRLKLAAARLANPSGVALRARNCQVGSSVSLTEGFSSAGEVDFYLARIDGRFDATGAWLHSPGGVALGLSRSEVRQSVLFNGVVATGQVSLFGAKLGGQAAFHGANLNNPGAVALNASQCEIAQSVWMEGGFTADGAVELVHARIADRLKFADARVTRLRATDLTVDILDDDPDCWPDDSHIGGMRYNSLPDDRRGAPSVRISWLNRLLPRYKPQPYAQLTTVYQAPGRHKGARVVAMAKEMARRRSRRTMLPKPVDRFWSVVLRWTIGYGFAPWRSLPWIAGLYLAAWTVFATAPKGAFTTTSQSTGGFQPALHAMDTLVPIVQLGAGTRWAATGGYVWWEVFFSASGWFVGAVLAAGFAGVFRRE